MTGAFAPCVKVPLHKPGSASGRTRACAASTVEKANTAKAGTRSTRFSIALLPGDGIGPEITRVTKRILSEAAGVVGVTLDYETANMGGIALDEDGVPFPDRTLEICRASDSVLLACIGGYKWDDNPRELRPETGLLQLRKSLGLFANLRPATVIPQLIDASTLKREIVEGVDIMVVRELTGDVYFGTPRGLHVDERTGKRVGYNNMIYHEDEIARIARTAFEIARKRGGRLCSVDKANVLDVSQLWRDVVCETHADYPDVDLSHMYVDNAAMQLIRAPRQFDTIVTGNIFGDILSDAASMLVGSLGMLPSASIGQSSGPAVFEPVHGSAPDIAGMDKANPIACVLSAAMMMRYDLDRPDIADILQRAVENTLNDGFRTGDIMSEGMTLVGCNQMGNAIVERIVPA